jgi:hypothetical protein
MAIFYLDFENGNDALDGTTFANRWKSITDGATFARIAPGDEIRIMGSPAPTSLGILGTWTSRLFEGQKFLNSAAANPSGSTNTTPIVIGSNSHGCTTGDTVIIYGHPGNTNANGVWEVTVIDADRFSLNGSSGNGNPGNGGAFINKTNAVIQLASPVTQNIASTGPGRSAWTASANVTTALSTTTKEGLESDQIAISDSFATGLAAYWALPSTLDLSGYEQVSFWIRQVSGTVGAAGAVDLRLCSDNAGVTAVNTVNIPNVATTGRWMPVTVDLGTALGSSIQSIAFYVNTDNGAQTFLLSNVIACKASGAADSLTLTSLIGKNVDDEGWWCIQSINSTRIMLDGTSTHSDGPTSTNARGYYGTAETVNTWKRETTKLDPSAPTASYLGGHQRINRGGSAAGGHITYSGGWDRSSMTTQNLETWLDNLNAAQNRMFATNSALDYIIFNRLCGARADTFIAMARAFYEFRGLKASSVNTITENMWSPQLGRRIYLEMVYLASCTRIFSRTSNSFGPFVVKIGSVIGATGAAGFHLPQLGNNSETIVEPIPGTAGIFANGANVDVYVGGSGTTIKNIRFTRNVQTEATCYAVNCLFDGSAEVIIDSGSLAQFFSHNHDQVANNHKIFLDGGLISSATDQRKTASGISWKIQPTSTERNSSLPIRLSLAKVACAANSLVTVKAWMRRSDTGLTMRLVCKGGQINGVDNDVVDAMTAAADTWAEQTITFTPAETGVVEITAESWGGTTFSGWVDDMTISQA